MNASPNIAAVTLTRVIVLTLLRLGGLLLLLSACFVLVPLVGVLEDLTRAADGYRWEMFRNSGKDEVVTILVRAGAGALLCVYSRRLTAWLVPAPGCLRCGHSLDPANAGVCPECGGR